MDLFEVNKYVGGTLAAILVVIVVSLLGDAAVAPAHLEMTVFPPPTEGEAEAEAEAKDEAAEEKPAAPSLGTLLAAADVAQGRKLAKKCIACHSFDKGGKNKVGPNLWNTVGQAKAGRQGYRYSSALGDAGGDWSYADLDAYLTKPKLFLPGGKMTFPGLADPAQRAAVIAFLRSLSDQPAALPGD
jgi:cytochrome c